MTTFEDSAIPFDQSDYACIDFVNSSFTDYRGKGEDTDRLPSPEWIDWFLDQHGVTPDDPEDPPIPTLVVVRRNVRRVLEKWADEVPLNGRDIRLLDENLRGAALRMRFTNSASGLALEQEPLERSWEWVIATIAASTVELLVNGEPARLKTCNNPSCSWMFYDQSINRSKLFCSTSPCGSLIRVRRFRARG